MKSLRNEIIVSNQLSFLCGPYEKGLSRRDILKKYMKNFNYIPFIVDDFLNFEKCDSMGLSVQLMEEILSLISPLNIILLDSMSTATEFGLFFNSGYIDNSAIILLPYRQDILDKNRVGVFLQGIIKQDKVRFHLVNYVPTIKKYALSTDVIQEWYGFVNDNVPKELQKYLEKVNDNYQESFVIDVSRGNNAGSKFNSLVFSKVIDNTITVYLKTRLIFYIMISILYEDSKLYKDIYFKDYSDSNIQDMTNKVCKIIINTYYESSLYIEDYFDNDVDFEKSGLSLIILSETKSSLEYLIKHIVGFVKLSYDKRKKYKLIDKSSDIVIDRSEIIKFNISDVFSGISEYEWEFLSDFTKNKNEIIRRFIIRNKSKSRKIQTYSDTDDGDKLRQIHTVLYKRLLGIHIFSDSSFAYKKNTRIVDVLEKHKDSIYFFKTDIKKFFNSIDKSILFEKMMRILNLNSKSEKGLKSILSTLFISDSMQLGMILSPILSDIYLNDFDIMMEALIKLNSNYYGFIYTRYADDIVISSKTMIDFEEIEKAIRGALEEIGLALNDDKTNHYILEKEGQHIKVLGINIVKRKYRNDITIGNKFLINVAKQYVKLLKGQNVSELSYSQTIGRVNFIESINDEMKKKFEYIVSLYNKENL